MDTNWKYCTLPTAKRLRELGLKQGMTEKYHWQRILPEVSDWFLSEGNNGNVRGHHDYKTVDAPDLSEAMMVLEKCKVSFHIYNTGVGEAIYRETGKIIDWDNKTIFPTEAACRMIVWLAENGLINLKEVKL